MSTKVIQRYIWQIFSELYMSRKSHSLFYHKRNQAPLWQFYFKYRILVSCLTPLLIILLSLGVSIVSGGGLWRKLANNIMFMPKIA